MVCVGPLTVIEGEIITASAQTLLCQNGKDAKDAVIAHAMTQQLRKSSSQIT